MLCICFKKTYAYAEHKLKELKGNAHHTLEEQNGAYQPLILTKIILRPTPNPPNLIGF